jgi:AAA domain
MRQQENIPAELRALKRWIPTYPDHKKTIKRWATPALRAENQESLDDLLASYDKGNKNWKAFSFGVDKADGFVFVDIDDCIVDGQIIPEVKELFKEVGPTYYEVSAGGHGLHLVYRGILSEDFVHQKPKDKPAHQFCFPWDVEIKVGEVNRRITLTGNNPYQKTPLPIKEGKLPELLAKLKATLSQADAGVKPKEGPHLTTSQDELLVTCANEYRLEAIEWLWIGKIPIRHSTLISGHTDVGKSIFWADVVARTTQGKDFPDAKMPEGIGGEVLIMAQEDDYNEVLCPRLVAAGADMKSIRFINGISCTSGDSRSERIFTFDEDIAKLEKFFEQQGCLVQLVVIDPISDYFGKGKSAKEKQDVSAIFNRLNDLARKYDLAIMVVEHFIKRGDVIAKHKIGGSVAMVTKPRAAWAFTELPEEEAAEGKGDHAMTWIKGNLGQKPRGLRYSIADKPLKVWSKSLQQWVDKPVPYIVWCGEETRTTDDLLADEKDRIENGGAGRKRDKCLQWLKEVLAHGEKLSRDVYTEGEALNFSEKTIKRAYRDGGFPEPIQRKTGWWMRPLLHAPAKTEPEPEEDETLKPNY